MLYNACELNFLNYLLHWLDFILWRTELFASTFCFWIIIMKRRKLATICWETSICFHLVVENSIFLVNICSCGASNCLNHFAFFLHNSERCNQSATPVLHYLMKFHKRQVLFKVGKLNIYVCLPCLTKVLFIRWRKQLLVFFVSVPIRV